MIIYWTVESHTIQLNTTNGENSNQNLEEKNQEIRRFRYLGNRIEFRNQFGQYFMKNIEPPLFHSFLFFRF